MSLVQFVPGETVIHQLDPRTKLALVPFVFILAFILSKPLPLLILLILIFMAWFYVRAPISYFTRILTVIITLTIFITIIQGLFYNQRSSQYEKSQSKDAPLSAEIQESAELIDLIPDVLRVGVVEEWFGSVDDPDRSFVLYKDGVILGITLGLRLGCIIAIMPLVTMTTSLTDLMLALVKLKVPWTIAYLVVTSFRFVPLLMNQTDTILNAQKIRGLAVEKAGLVKKITAYAPLAIPVILGAFRNSEQLEMVLACRGFTNITVRSTLYEIGWKSRDTMAIIFMFLIFNIRNKFSTSELGFLLI